MCQKLPTLAFFAILTPLRGDKTLQKHFYVEFPTAFLTVFPAAFPTRFPTAFPTEFPTRFPAAFPGEFPTRFPAAFPKLDADWLTPHHPFQMLYFHQSLPC